MFLQAQLQLKTCNIYGIVKVRHFCRENLQMANNFKSWKMRKKLKADFGKCFGHEWLVFVVHFENSLTPQ